MKIGDRVYTPRFCNVVIKEVFNNRKEAKEAGYTEPTYLFQDGYGVAGKTLDEYHMEFCAFKEK